MSFQTECIVESRSTKENASFLNHFVDSTGRKNAEFLDSWCFWAARRIRTFWNVLVLDFIFCYGRSFHDYLKIVLVHFMAS